MLKLLLFGLFVSANAAATESLVLNEQEFPYGELRPFTTDAYTLFPDGTPDDPTKWQNCCVLHDVKYWAGGNRDQRLKADQDLRACVASTGEAVIAETMFVGVRTGGNPYLPTPWRWGYGWPEIRGYSELTPEEEAEVTGMTPADPRQAPIVKLMSVQKARTELAAELLSH